MRTFLLALVGCFPFLVSATWVPSTMDLSRMQDRTEFTVQGITTPKVVRYKQEQAFDIPLYLFEKKYDDQYLESDLLPRRVVHSYEKNDTRQKFTVTSVSSEFAGNKNDMIDNDSNTHLMFDSNSPEHVIEIAFDGTKKVSEIYMILGTGDLEPYSVTIEGRFPNNQWQAITSQRPYYYQMRWPEVEVNALRFTVRSNHLFRVSELYMLGDQQADRFDELVFFAEEGKTYVLFSRPSFGQKSYSALSSLPLNTDNQTPLFELPQPSPYAGYKNDFDEDGLPDSQDLCPRVADSQNLDVDRNGRGDVCEDPDQDGFMSHKDNCPYVYNPSQKDSDEDGEGDDCDGVENRFTENQDFLLYGVFGLAILLLGYLVVKSLPKAPSKK